MGKKRLQNIALDPDFVAQLKVFAAANNKSMAELSREFTKGDNDIKRILQRLKLQ